MSEERNILERRRLIGESIRPPDVTIRSERPQDRAVSGPVVVNIGRGPTTNPPVKSDAAAGSASPEAGAATPSASGDA